MLNQRGLFKNKKDRDNIYIYIYIYIYIFTNLISTSIHGTRKKKKNPGQEQEIKVSRITAQGKKEKNLGKKEKKRPTSSDHLKKIKGYAVSGQKKTKKPSELRLPDDPLRWNFSRRFYIYIGKNVAVLSIGHRLYLKLYHLIV